MGLFSDRFAAHIACIAPNKIGAASEVGHSSTKGVLGMAPHSPVGRGADAGKGYLASSNDLSDYALFRPVNGLVKWTDAPLKCFLRSSTFASFYVNAVLLLSVFDHRLAVKFYYTATLGTPADGSSVKLQKRMHRGKSKATVVCHVL